MLKKTITYTDYDGNVRTDTVHFNLSKAELAEMELSTPGGMQQKLSKIVNEHNNQKLVQVFKEFIMKSYGVKSDDGKRFVKSPELTEEFMQTEAYSALFMELISDANAASAFMTGIIPKDLAMEIANKQTPAG